MASEKDVEVITFEFPIKDSRGVAQTKRIPPHVLPNFHSLENEDPDVFLFQFEILCRGYGYCSNDQKLNVFPLTSRMNNPLMVHEPRWEFYTNLGRHETCILEKVPILL